MGTLVNVIAILIGGILGLFFGRYLKPSMQKTLILANGVCVLFLGMQGALEKMLDGSYTMMLILSLGLGTMIGEWIDIEKGLDAFGTWLKKISGNANNSLFMEGFISSTLTVCIGAMAIVGSIQDGLLHDPSTLYAKSLLDLMIIFVFSASLGIGCLFSAFPVGILQGSLTLLASFLTFLLNEKALNNISVVGNILIFCVGLNLIFPKTIKVANLLPALLFAILFAFIA